MKTQAAILDPGIEAQMRLLHLPHARRTAAEIIATAMVQRWDPVQVLSAVLAEEISGRAQISLRRRLSAAGLPTGKTLETYDLSLSCIPEQVFSYLVTLQWVDRGENLVVCGPAGTGKSFLCEALAHKAITQGKKVLWTKIDDLGVLVDAHRVDTSIARAIKRFTSCDLVVVDDIGLLPITQGAAEGLYRLVDSAYESRSLAFSSNLHPSTFDQIMPKTLATATVDRLMHHAHVCQTSGDSIRLAQAMAGKGVVVPDK